MVIESRFVKQYKVTFKKAGEDNTTDIYVAADSLADLEAKFRCQFPFSRGISAVNKVADVLV